MGVHSRSMMLRIRFDRLRLIAGEPCVEITSVNNGSGSINRLEEVWPGFEFNRGVMYVKAAGGHAWMEFFGEDTWIRSGGREVEPTATIEQRFLNWFPSGQLEQLDNKISYVAVNRGRVCATRPAVTIYQATGCCLVPEARLDGSPLGDYVQSVVVRPPAVRTDEPLNCWLEATRVDY